MAPYSGEDVKFASTVVHNVCAYLFRKIFNEETEYRFCNYYSYYCNEVIINFLDNHCACYYREFEERCKDLQEARQLLLLGHDIFLKHFWNDPSDASFFECCARLGVLAVYLAHHEKRFHIADLVLVRNLPSVRPMMLLHENYDEGRWHARGLLAAMYKWALEDLEDHLSEVDRRLGWDEIDLPEAALNYLDGCGVDLLVFWSVLKPFRNMTKAKFLGKALHIQKTNIEACNGTEAQRFEFACKIGLLSLHSVRHGFKEGATICVDMFTKFFLKSYMKTEDSEDESESTETDTETDSGPIDGGDEDGYLTVETESEFGEGEIESVECDFQKLNLESNTVESEHVKYESESIKEAESKLVKDPEFNPVKEAESKPVNEAKSLPVKEAKSLLVKEAKSLLVKEAKSVSVKEAESEPVQGGSKPVKSESIPLKAQPKPIRENRRRKKKHTK